MPRKKEVFKLITIAAFDRLKSFGELVIYDFAGVLYKVKKEHYWEMKGIIGNNYFNVIYCCDELEDCINDF